MKIHMVFAKSLGIFHIPNTKRLFSFIITLTKIKAIFNIWIVYLFIFLYKYRENRVKRSSLMGDHLNK